MSYGRKINEVIDSSTTSLIFLLEIMDFLDLGHGYVRFFSNEFILLNNMDDNEMTQDFHRLGVKKYMSLWMSS